MTPHKINNLGHSRTLSSCLQYSYCINDAIFRRTICVKNWPVEINHISSQQKLSKPKLDSAWNPLFLTLVHIFLWPLRLTRDRNLISHMEQVIGCWNLEICSESFVGSISSWQNWQVTLGLSWTSRWCLGKQYIYWLLQCKQNINWLVYYPDKEYS